MREPRSLVSGNATARRRLPRVWRHPRRAWPPPLASEDGRPPVERSLSKRSRLEAVLWTADRPLSERRLARLAGLESVAEARELIEELQRHYASRGSAVEVAAVAGGRRLLTRPAFEPWLEKGLADQREEPLRISQSALEALAVAAYRQPVLRAEIEAIRGVGCGELLRQLLDADLLRIVGRSTELGRPLLYGTTARFLELFGLGGLDDLPRPAASVGEARPTKHNASRESTRAA